MNKIKKYIRDIPDFPEPGIGFKDITPLLANPDAFHQTIDTLKIRHQNHSIDMVVGIEARGFIFASALAYALEAGTCLVRKLGKLPHTTYQKTYDLEYGTDTLEIQTDAFGPGQRILIVDDVLATGGTVAATVELIRNHFEVEIVEIDFLMELMFLNGRAKLANLPIHSLLEYSD
ncbi:MAG: adenine phosphoribosyltransferase [Kiritimatiellaceae bacterium]|nr:adenine phosphoribosyltransferase [Kiritimatiellaceae bacterium]